MWSYFLATLMGRQFLEEDHLDYVVPIFTYLQFLFYVGWMKVGETLASPFGEDDSEVVKIIERNIKVRGRLARFQRKRPIWACDFKGYFDKVGIIR